MAAGWRRAGWRPTGWLRVRPGGQNRNFPCRRPEPQVSLQFGSLVAKSSTLLAENHPTVQISWVARGIYLRFYRALRLGPSESARKVEVMPIAGAFCKETWSSDQPCLSRASALPQPCLSRASAVPQACPKGRALPSAAAPPRIAVEPSRILARSRLSPPYTERPGSAQGTRDVRCKLAFTYRDADAAASRRRLPLLFPTVRASFARPPPTARAPRRRRSRLRACRRGTPSPGRCRRSRTA